MTKSHLIEKNKRFSPLKSDRQKLRIFLTCKLSQRWILFLACPQ